MGQECIRKWGPKGRGIDDREQNELQIFAIGQGGKLRALKIGQDIGCFAVEEFRSEAEGEASP